MGDGLPLFAGFLDLGIHEIAHCERKLRLGVERRVVVTLDGHIEQDLPVHPILGKIRGGRGPKYRGKRVPSRNFIRASGHA